MAIVGLEPSCLLRHARRVLDYRFGEDAKLIARHALLFEEFLARETAMPGRLTLALGRIAAGEALSACALPPEGVRRGDGRSQPVLGWIPGLATRTIESSCCGMAGAFGYEAEHYDISMRMAEAALLPVGARCGATGVLIAADGFSCRAPDPRRERARSRPCSRGFSSARSLRDCTIDLDDARA